jgi:ankyrin repeat protein
LDAGADPNLASSDGETMLITAAYLGNVETVKLLIDSGAKVNIPNAHGDTALASALRGEKERGKLGPEVAKEFQSVIDYLRSHGAE